MKDNHDDQYMDAVHPQHNPVLAQGWIERGEPYEIRSNSSRVRLNIKGAINLEQPQPVVRYADRINNRYFETFPEF